jgi:hypothetical protein
MNDSAIDFADFVYRSRLQALRGVDEIVEDVVKMLEAKGVANNTYSKSHLIPKTVMEKTKNPILTVLPSSILLTTATTSASTVFLEGSPSSTTKT